MSPPCPDRSARALAIRMRSSIAAAAGLSLSGCASPPATADDGAVEAVTVVTPDPLPTAEADPPEPTATASAEAKPSQGWKSGAAYCVPRQIANPSGTTCGDSVPNAALEAIPEGPTGVFMFAFDQAATDEERARVKDACCYGIRHPTRGRPLRDATPDRGVVTARAEQGAGWARPVAIDVGSDDARRRAAASAWEEDALVEHASAAEFSRVALALLALGAPAELVARAQQAALDEVRHAEIAFSIASALRGAPLRPGPLPIPLGPRLDDVVELARATILDGCIGETLASLEARRAALLSGDAQIAASLEVIASEEERHAAFAFAVVRFCLASATREQREVIDAILAQASAELAASLDGGSRCDGVEEAPFGRLAADEIARVRADGARHAVLPLLEALAA